MPNLTFSTWRFLLLTLGLIGASCSSKSERLQKERSKLIEIASEGDLHHWKDWPGTDSRCTVKMSQVTDTHAIFGPDFTVHYFSLAPSSSVALYRGGYPRTRTDEVKHRFTSRFAGKTARWEVCATEDGRLSAWAYVESRDEEIRLFWHLMINAPSLERVKQIANECESFHMTVDDKSA